MRLGSGKVLRHNPLLSLTSFNEHEMKEAMKMREAPSPIELMESEETFFKQNRWSTSRIVEYRKVEGAQSLMNKKSKVR